LEAKVADRDQRREIDENKVSAQEEYEEEEEMDVILLGCPRERDG